MMVRAHSEIIGRLREIGPFSDDASASRALVVTLQALADYLSKDERSRLRRALPPELRASVTTTRRPLAGDLADFFRHVAALDDTRPGIAVERTEVVCQALGEILSPEARVVLERAIPKLDELFATRDAPEPPFAPHGPTPGAPRDLAEGRPGGRHPLSSANPALVAHRDSIARSADPHADSKLSSSQGLTQEREGHSLATGRPGSRRPISTGH
jgi:uncharacterized protein (DUF2267 family)